MHHKHQQKHTAIRDLPIPTPTPQPTTPIQPITLDPLLSSPAHHPSAPPTSTSIIHPSRFGTLLSDIVVQPFEWLWQDRIPLGHLTLLEGQSGLGTSLVALHLAASISAHRPLPDGTTSPNSGVIIIAPHEHAARTIAPRLHAFGADLAHIRILSSLEHHSDLDDYVPPDKRPFNLPDDLPWLELAINRMQASLVILDPFTALIDHSPTCQRTIFMQLTYLAQRTNCAILLIRPCPSQSLTRIPLPPPNGSLHLLSALRSSLLLLPDPDQPEHTLLISTKHSYSAPPHPIILTIKADPQGLPSIEWHGERQQPLLTQQQALSLHRQRVLTQLQESPTPLDAPSLTDKTTHDYDSTRKLLQRMLKNRQLISPARGLYTTPTHPSLTPPPTDSSSLPPSPLPVPTVPSPNGATVYGRDSSRPAGGRPSSSIHATDRTFARDAISQVSAPFLPPSPPPVPTVPTVPITQHQHQPDPLSPLPADVLDPLAFQSDHASQQTHQDMQELSSAALA